MDTLAKAVVIAIQYIASRDAGANEDDDVRKIEGIAAILKDASVDEKMALVEAPRILGFPEFPEHLGII